VHPTLNQAVLEIERHVAAIGWDQPTRLYALVDTASLIRSEPGLAADLGLPADLPVEALPPSFTPVEQDEFPADQPLDEVLARVAWGPAVDGCALALERLMLPPAAEANLPEDDDEAQAYASAHPDRQEVRIVVGVLRDGSVEGAVRLRTEDRDDAVMFGSALVPGLAKALVATFAEAPEDDGD
jgi:hypothetical protein